MNALRGSTLSPISSVKMLSASVASSIVTRCRVRDAGSMVVSRELLGVHLAEALEALHRDAVAGELEHRAAQLAERFGLARCVAEGDRERRPADLLQQILVDLDQVAVVVGGEQRRRQRVDAREAVAARDGA